MRPFVVYALPHSGEELFYQLLLHHPEFENFLPLPTVDYWMQHPLLLEKLHRQCKRDKAFVVRINRRNRLRQAVSYYGQINSLGERFSVDIEHLKVLLKFLDRCRDFQCNSLTEGLSEYRLNFEHLWIDPQMRMKGFWKMIGRENSIIYPTRLRVEGRALIQTVSNYEELHRAMVGTRWEEFL